jgi:hypothetical protein
MMNIAKKGALALALGVGLAPSSWAYQSVDGFIKDADELLTMKQMSKLLDRDDAMSVAKLAQEEDMEALGPYLVSDDMLRMMRRSGLVKTEFGLLMEEFQAECDRLTENERLEAMAAWRSLWLEKSFAYLKYIKSLKPVWGADLMQSMDYNSNVSLRDPDSPGAVNTLGMRDTGMTLNGTLRYRPTINREKKLGWSYLAKLDVLKQSQSSVEEVQYETVSLDHGFRMNQPMEGVQNVSFNWNYMRSYSKDPASERMDYGRHAFKLGLVSEIKSVDGKWATGYMHNASLQYRAKEEYPGVGGFAPIGNDLDTVVLNYGMTYLKAASDTPFQTLSWNLSYEQQSGEEDSSVNAGRDYDVWALMVGYSRGLSDFISEYNMNLSSSLSYRFKDGDGSGRGTVLEDQQWLASVALNATWTAYWSSSFSVSYLNKVQDKIQSLPNPQVPRTNDSEQWRVAWTNILSTF